MNAGLGPQRGWAAGSWRSGRKGRVSTGTGCGQDSLVNSPLCAVLVARQLSHQIPTFRAVAKVTQAR
jgi:hypothetical protein